LDPSFGERGIVTTELERTSVAVGYAAALDDKGRLLVAGYSGDSKEKNAPSWQTADWSTRIMLARYTVKGVLDDSFGTHGIASLEIEHQDPYPHRNSGRLRDFLFYDGYDRHPKSAALTLDRTGRAVVAATNADGNIFLARFTAEGVVDADFGKSGLTQTTIADGAYVNALLEERDGRLLVVGSTGAGALQARYSADGTADSKFGDEGVQQTPLADGARVSSALLDDEGYLFMAARSEHSIVVARFDAAGKPDSNFGTQGAFSKTFDQQISAPVGLAISSQGFPVAASLTADGVAIVGAEKSQTPR